MSSTAAVVPGVTYHLPKAVEGSYNHINSERDHTHKRFFSKEADSENVTADGCTNVQSPNFASASFDAALRNSLRPLLHDKSSPFDSHYPDACPKFLQRTLSFRESDAPPLDTIIRQRIQSLPRHLILTDTDNQKSKKPTRNDPVLCDDSELERLCRAGCQYIPRHPLGLGNAGNTCYLNSVLQCLLATGPLLAYITTKHSSPNTCTVATGQAANLQSGLNKSRFCGLCALMRLLKEHSQRSQSSGATNYACSLGGQIVPSYFVGNVRAVCPNFHPYQQEDAHEFLLGMLSRMEDCAMAEMGKLSRNVAETNAIRRIFGGVIRSEVTCHSCRKVSTVNEMCFNLSVDITCGRSLQQCLSNYIRSEELCGQNAYKCENSLQKNTYDHLNVSQIPLPPSTPLLASKQATDKPSITPFTVRKPPPSFLPRIVINSDRSRSSFNAMRSPSTESQKRPTTGTEPCASSTPNVVDITTTTTSTVASAYDPVNHVGNTASSSSALHQLLYRDVYSTTSWEERSPPKCNSKQEGPSATDPGPNSTSPFTEFRKSIPNKRKLSPSPSGECLAKRSSASTSSVYYSPDKHGHAPNIDNATSSSSAKLTATSSGDDSDSSIVWVPANHLASSVVQKKDAHRRKKKQKIHSRFLPESQINQYPEVNGERHHRCRHHRRRHKKRGHKRHRHSGEHRELNRYGASEHDRSHYKFHKLHR
ncbi:unnamed protein product [Dicrocoelium dendriticum]|nr:unnamed protein product [Dicrocoelium dendriticum]